MNNSLKNHIDNLSLVKDISERDRIIEQYQRFGILDRIDAIDKIKELRLTDSEVATVAIAELAKGSIRFEQCTNDQIISELIMQRNLLQTKLVKKQIKEIKYNDIS